MGFNNMSKQYAFNCFNFPHDIQQKTTIIQKIKCFFGKHLMLKASNLLGDTYCLFCEKGPNGETPEERQKIKSKPGRIEINPHKWDTLPSASNFLDLEEEDLSNYKTCELFEELKKREGVQVIDCGDPGYSYNINTTYVKAIDDIYEEEVSDTGPAVILIITD
jgi:hypothetical protein